MDLLIVRGHQRIGFEIKRTSTPAMTPSIRSALSDLKLKKLHLIHAGDDTFQLDKKVRAVAMSRLLDDITPIQ